MAHMNEVFSAQDKYIASSLKDYISGALICNIAGSLQDNFIILLRRAILLARWRWVREKLLRIQFAPLHLYAGKGPTSAFDTGGALDYIQPGACIHQPPHEAKVATRHGLSRPQPDYEALHGQIGRAHV